MHHLRTGQPCNQGGACAPAPARRPLPMRQQRCRWCCSGWRACSVTACAWGGGSAYLHSCCCCCRRRLLESPSDPVHRFPQVLNSQRWGHSIHHCLAKRHKLLSLSVARVARGHAHNLRACKAVIWASHTEAGVHTRPHSAAPNVPSYSRRSAPQVESRRRGCTRSGREWCTTGRGGWL